MFKVNIKDTPCSSVSIVKFEKVNVDWESQIGLCLFDFKVLQFFNS